MKLYKVSALNKNIESSKLYTSEFAARAAAIELSMNDFYDAVYLVEMTDELSDCELYENIVTKEYTKLAWL